jgi:hypothetical protein
MTRGVITVILALLIISPRHSTAEEELRKVTSKVRICIDIPEYQGSCVDADGRSLACPRSRNCYVEICEAEQTLKFCCGPLETLLEPGQEYNFKIEDFPHKRFEDVNEVWKDGKIIWKRQNESLCPRSYARSKAGCHLRSTTPEEEARGRIRMGGKDYRLFGTVCQGVG